jgi:Transposase DDE domain group 1
MFRELASATYGPEVKMNGLSCRRELLAVTVLLVGLLGLVKFYNGRGTAEQWIKEGKNALRWTRLSCHAFRHNAVRLQLHALAYNLANFVRTLALPEEVEHWSLTTLREKLVKIGARVVRHGRYVVFQLAEVAVPRALFAEILRRIDRLRPRPLLT